MKNIKLLHVADDSVFLDYAIELFEAANPGGNVFLVNTGNPKKIKQREKIIAVDGASEDYRSQLQNLDAFDAVCIHALTHDKIELVLNHFRKIKLVWFFWGADGFYINKLKSRIFSKKTLRAIDIANNVQKMEKIKRWFLQIDMFAFPFYMLKYNKLPDDFRRRQAIRKVDYCAPVLQEDYFFLKNYISFKAKSLDFTYGSLDNLINNKLLTLTGNNILLGNCGDPANNHLDMIDHLKTRSLDCTIVTPLSYGPDLNYIKYIMEYGKNELGEKFHPLDTFMPLEDYNKIISGCSIVIMNHYIQKAMGNIISCLWLGAKLYLSKKNTVTTFLKKHNVIFFIIEDDLGSPDAFHPLNDEQRLVNRKFIEHYYSKSNSVSKTKELIQKIIL